jgi:hypothetical protein
MAAPLVTARPGAAHISVMSVSTAIAVQSPSFAFQAAGREFTLVRNASDHFNILDAELNLFTMFSYGGDPEDSFELEAAAVVSVEHKLAQTL